jgi:membrane-bound lytic murein transglycosylase MltF
MAKLIVNIILLLPIIVYGCLTTNAFDPTSANEPQNERFRSYEDRKMVVFMDKYGTLVKKYSGQYGIDWRLVLAVAKQESQFHHGAESYMGAVGVMQIMPNTGAQIANELGLDSIELVKPSLNIKGGIYYLAKLYNGYRREGLSEENSKKMALAAYNAGIGRVEDARKLSKYLNDSPNQWLSVKNSLSMLSSRYASLHQHVWAEGRPTAGYFKRWRQTTVYVDEISHLYSEICAEFPRNS